jgi:hypothetical protein
VAPERALGGTGELFDRLPSAFGTVRVISGLDVLSHYSFAFLIIFSTRRFAFSTEAKERVPVMGCPSKQMTAFPAELRWIDHFEYLDTPSWSFQFRR